VLFHFTTLKMPRQYCPWWMKWKNIDRCFVEMHPLLNYFIVRLIKLWIFHNRIGQMINMQMIMKVETRGWELNSLHNSRRPLDYLFALCDRLPFINWVDLTCMRGIVMVMVTDRLYPVPCAKLGFFSSFQFQPFWFYLADTGQTHRSQTRGTVTRLMSPWPWLSWAVGIVVEKQIRNLFSIRSRWK